MTGARRPTESNTTSMQTAGMRGLEKSVPMIRLRSKHGSGVPVYLGEAGTLVARLTEEEKIGIVPEGVIPAYCGDRFPDEHIIDFMNLPYEDREKFLPYCTWYKEQPVTLIKQA